MPNCSVLALWTGLKEPLAFGTGRLELFRSGTPRASRNPLLVIVPGGSYRVLAPQDCTPVAELLCEHGYHAAVLYYRVKPHAFPNAVADLSRALRLMRKNAAMFSIDPDRIGVVGFSAGGHLAGLSAFAPHLHRDADDDLVDTVSPRPDRLSLVYPVVRLALKSHHRSAQNFFGAAQPGPETTRGFDLDFLVEPGAPPFQLTHAVDDPIVPISPSLALLDRAAHIGVEVQANILPSGGHGFVVRPGVAGTTWPGPLLDWFESL